MSYRQKLLLLSLTTLFSLASYSQLHSAVITEEGVFGVQLNLRGDIAFSRPTPSVNSIHSVFASGLYFWGAAPFYSVVTEATLIDDMAHLAQYYAGTSNFLNKDSIHPFIFFDTSLSYISQSIDDLNLLFLVGGKLGHLGYLVPRLSYNPYMLYIAPVLQIYWFPSTYISLLTKIDIPLPFFHPNVGWIWHIRTLFELTFDPFGQIRNIVSSIVLFSMGLRYDFATFSPRNSTDRLYVSLLEPYFKLTLLY